ncbi:MAG: DUF1549 domain-containing protein [Acidobacteriota bacterium]
MNRFTVAAAAGLLIAGSGLLAIRAQEAVDDQQVSAPTVDAGELPVADPICTFFGKDHDKFVEALQAASHNASQLTDQVVSKLAPGAKVMSENFATSMLPSAPGGSRTDSMQNPAGIIDKYIFQKMADQKVAPAPPTTDQEFLRRVTLDLTGRIPTPEVLIGFLNDSAPDKRAKMIDQLLAKPEWVDKWTVWLADLYENNSQNDLDARRYPSGVSAFNSFIRTSLQQDKPYNKMVREMIASTGTNSYQQGEMNFLIGGVMGGGPIQDVFDQQTATIAEKFLGLAHVNCLLCHNGRGHLDSLSLWGYYKTRTEAWSMASFMSHTATVRIPVDGAINNNPYYWSIQNNVTVGRTNYTVDYQLNTQTGNRPARGATNSKQTVKPAFILNAASPAASSDYRAFLADQLTADFQFARATVNYMWEYFYGIGLVTPSNQFDPMRLDPDDPPADCPMPTSPCELQASHPRLLNELAQSFINSGYNLKSLMRQITNSRAYQLSSRYEGTWNPTNERLFARKLVRRLWSEEVHDAIVQSFGVPVTYTNANWNPQTVNWAMQLPEPLNTPGGSVTTFLNAFLRGNRDTEPRRPDATISQALALMNDNFVMTRVTSNNTASVLVNALKSPDDQAVGTLYLSVLSRYPTAQELAAGVANLKGAANAAARTQEGRNLLWSLYNKVDFIFNY